MHFFSKCLSCFFSSSLLYSFLQAGRFTTKRQRESPINLVANHALDSSVDLCLCPSVCICSFLLPFAHFHTLCLTFIYLHPFVFLSSLLDIIFHPPYRPPSPDVLDPFLFFNHTLVQHPQILCSVYFFPLRARCIKSQAYII